MTDRLADMLRHHRPATAVDRKGAARLGGGPAMAEFIEKRDPDFTGAVDGRLYSDVR